MPDEKKSPLKTYLQRLARARPNDAVKLAFFSQEDAVKISRLDLSLVSEIKRSATGATEIKLIDKAGILAALAQIEKEERLEKSQGNSFYDALDRAAARLSQEEAGPGDEPESHGI